MVGSEGYQEASCSGSSSQDATNLVAFAFAQSLAPQAQMPTFISDLSKAHRGEDNQSVCWWTYVENKWHSPDHQSKQKQKRGTQSPVEACALNTELEKEMGTV